MGIWKKILWALTTGALLAICVAAVFEFSGGRRRQTDVITILRGQNTLQIADDLKAEGYIKSKLFFLFEVVKTANFHNLKYGEYDLKNLSQTDIINRLVSGKTAAKTITVIPGQTIRDISSTLGNAKLAAGEDLLNMAVDTAKFRDDFDFLEQLPDDSDLEGYLYPDTYQINPKAGAESIARTMLENFSEKLAPEIRRQALARKISIHQIVTMASLLEKEVKTLEDKKIVSGILWKRLENKMPLQVDSGLLYYKISDTKTINKDIDSPYNTYKYAGLPPGPICNPDIGSIEAAIEPIDTAYWYYLSAPDGTTVFSKNYGEHLINKEKYLNN